MQDLVPLNKFKVYLFLFNFTDQLQVVYGYTKRGQLSKVQNTTQFTCDRLARQVYVPQVSYYPNLGLEYDTSPFIKR